MAYANWLAGLVMVLWLAFATNAGSQSIGTLEVGSDAAQAAEEARRAAAAAPAPAQTPQPAAPPSFLLRRIEIGSSALLPSADIQTVVSRWEGRRVTRTALSELLSELQALYGSRSLGLAQPVLVAVNPESGHIRIDLFEPRVGSFRSLDPAVSDAYLSYRLRLDPDRPLDTRVLAARLDRLSLSDDIRIDSTLEPGEAPDLVDLSVGLSGAPARAGSLIFDTFGRETTGPERVSLTYGWRSLTGWNDPFSVSATLFRGGYNAAMSYARVVNPDGARMIVSLDQGKTRTLSAPEVRNRTWGMEAGLSVPLLLQDRYRLGAALSVLNFAETGTIVGVPSFSQAGQGLRFALSGQVQGADWLMSASTSMTALRWEDRMVGLSQSSKLLGVSFAAARRVAPVVLSIQGSAQIADSPAPARMRFSAAGPGAVRGYHRTVVSDDSGYFARIQVEAAEPLALGEHLTGRPYAFFDAGRVYARVGGRHVAGFAPSSAGIGASFGLGRSAMLDVFLARQLTTAPGNARRETVLSVSVPFRF